MKEPGLERECNAELTESDVQELEAHTEDMATPTKKGPPYRHHSEQSPSHGLLHSGLRWSLHPEEMNDRELLVCTLGEIQQLRRQIRDETAARESLQLKMLGLEDVVLMGMEDMEVTRERWEALAEYFQEQLNGMADEADAEFTDGAFESASEDEDAAGVGPGSNANVFMGP